MKSTLLSRALAILSLFLVFEGMGLLSLGGKQTYAQEKREKVTTEGEGEAEIQGQDLNHARQEALKNALQNAFEKALFEVLPEGLSLAEHQNLLETLAPMRTKYLLQFRILAEMPALQVFFMTVEATFSNTLIQEELTERGISTQENSEKEPVTFDLSLRGVTSFGVYQDLLELLPKKIYGIESINPVEVYATLLVIRVTYRGDPSELEEAVRQCLLDRQQESTGANDEPEKIEITVSPLSVASDDSNAIPEEKPSPSEDKTNSPKTP